MESGGGGVVMEECDNLSCLNEVVGGNLVVKKTA